MQYDSYGDLNVALHGQRLCRVLSSYPHLAHVVHLPQKQIFQMFKNISVTTFCDTKNWLIFRRDLLIQFVSWTNRVAASLLTP